MNIRWYKVADSANIVREAMRKLKGYAEKIDGYDVRSLIDYELSKENYNYILHPSLAGENDIDKNPVRDAYIKQIGKTPRKDGVFGTCIVTLPRVVGRDEEDFPDISEMDVEEARKAMCKFYAGYEKGKRWLEAAVDSFIEIMGIRVDDVLYATLHMEETTPHVHIGFLPTYVMKDRDGNIKKDDAGSEIRGCDRSIVSRGFLKTFHKKMVDEIKRRNQPHADAIVTGEGYLFDPQKMNRTERIVATEAMIRDEILQARVEKGLVTPEDSEGRFYYKKNQLRNRDTRLKEKEIEIVRKSEVLNSLQIRETVLLNKLDKMEKGKEIFELELQDKIADMESNLKGLVDGILRDISIELIGLSVNEASEKIRVLCDDIAVQFLEEIAPVKGVLEEMKDSLLVENEDLLDEMVEEERV